MPTQQPPPIDRCPRPTWTLLLGLAAIAIPPALAVADDPGPATGEQIYRQRCASCHGDSGEGTEDAPRPLAGDRSVMQLSRFIAKTMPEDDPGTCVDEDADKVAAFIHDAFYSRAAQARNKPPRIELSRLTVRQYRNAVTDLIGSFRPAAARDDRQGLHGEYFDGNRRRNNKRLIDRIDPEVRFDFGVAGPEPEKFGPHKFSIRWEGSVLAPETGDYEFIVRTEHAARLWVNDPKRPLIDAGVKSGDDTEYRGSIYLLGGRAYDLRLEFSKGKQGEPDNKKKQEEPPPTKASIALEWKPPRGVEETIPRRNLSPGRSPELFVAATPFPPDDRSVGYERGSSVSKAWDQATTDAAIEVAGYVVPRLRELADARDDAPDREDKLREFARRFAERAFRRPLSDDQKRLYVDRQFDEAGDPGLALKRVVLLVLKSPRFLYREIDGSTDPYDVASRLSFGLWDSIPDQALRDAAASGGLATREQVAAQAERMVPDLRTRSKLRDFLLQWLRVDQAPEVFKDSEQFPGFDAGIVADLRTSLELTLEDAVWGESSDFRRLLTSDELYLNGRLAQFYGAPLPPDAPFQKAYLESSERAGVLSHPYLLAAFAYTATSSPIHRGVFIARNVLGRTLRPPPDAFSPLAPDLHPQLTTRERVTLQTSPDACIKCHGMINPLGFPLEQFDAVGRYRKEEKGKPIDAKGSYRDRSGETVEFWGARDLASYLAGSDESHGAFVEQLFHYLIKQPIRAYGPDRSAELRQFFTGNGFHVRKLVVEILSATALTAREPTLARREPPTPELPDDPFAGDRHSTR